MTLIATLDEVCRTMLDNADMQINFSAFPKVQLEMVVFGSVQGKFWKVLFDCGQVMQMNAEFNDDAGPNDLFMVLETRVTEIAKRDLPAGVRQRADRMQDDDLAWHIDIYGDVILSLFTARFDWRLVELTEAEYNAWYS